MPIEINTDSNNDIVIEVEAGQGNANVTVDSQSQIISAIGTTALYGPKGDKGDQGDPGENATIEIGTVATGEPGTSVIVENAGTDTNAVLNFTIPRGDTGEAGADGQDGQDGFSPSATIEQTASGATITITDKDGTTTADISNGVDGQDGADGADGVGISSIEKTSSSGLVDTYTITYTDTNTDTFDVTNGADGQDGQDGTDGQDGYSPTATVSKSGTVSTITITDKNGTTTAQVLDGAGGVSDVEVNGSSVVSGGVASVTVPTDTSDLTNSAGYITSSALSGYATTSDLGNKQDTLVSGTNIKTINNESVLGTGNLETLNYNQITNCILEAPNGIFATSGRTFTLKAGLKVLMPDGFNSDYTLKNTVYTVETNIVADYSNYSQGQTRIIFLKSDGTLSAVNTTYVLGYFSSLAQLPDTVESTNTYLAYTRYQNNWYYTSGSTTASWQVATPRIPILTAYFDTNTITTQVHTYPIKIVETSMADGQWRYNLQTIASNATAPTSADVEYSLASYLPRDDFDYEVLFSMYGSTAASANSYAIGLLGTDKIADARVYATRVAQGSSNAVGAGGNAVLPVGMGRKVIVGSYSNNTGTYTLKTLAYRRLGTNS